MASHKIAQSKKSMFIEAFRKSGIISAGARAAGVNRRRHYEWLENDSAYAIDYKEAVEDATDVLEAAAVERATREKNPSDTMLIVLLKMRGRFVERREFSGPGGGPMQIQAMTPEDRLIAARIVNRQLDTDTPRPQLNGSTNASTDS